MAAKPSNNGFSIDASVLPAATVDTKCSINWNFYRSLRRDIPISSLVTQPTLLFPTFYPTRNRTSQFVEQEALQVTFLSSLPLSMTSQRRRRIDERKERNGDTIKRYDWSYFSITPRGLCRVTRQSSQQIRERNLGIVVNVLHVFQLPNDFARRTCFAFCNSSRFLSR